MPSYTFGAITQQGQRQARPDWREIISYATYQRRYQARNQDWTPLLHRNTRVFMRRFIDWPRGGKHHRGPGSQMGGRSWRSWPRREGHTRFPYAIARTVRNESGQPISDARAILLRSSDYAYQREARTLADGTFSLGVEDNTTNYRVIVQTNDGRTGATIDSVVGA